MKIIITPKKALEQIQEIGIRKERLAEAMNITPTLLSRYLNGSRPIPEKHQTYLAKRLPELSKSITKILK